MSRDMIWDPDEKPTAPPDSFRTLDSYSLGQFQLRFLGELAPGTMYAIGGSGPDWLGGGSIVGGGGGGGIAVTGGTSIAVGGGVPWRGPGWPEPPKPSPSSVRFWAVDPGVNR